MARISKSLTKYVCMYVPKDPLYSFRGPGIHYWNEFWMPIKLSVCLPHISKMKIMLVMNKIRDKPCNIYNNEPLEIPESPKFLGLEFPPSNHR